MRYPVVDCSDLVGLAQLAVLLAVLVSQLVRHLEEHFTFDSVSSGPVHISTRHIRRSVPTTLSSHTSDWMRGAAQMRVETASCRPGSTSLLKRSDCKDELLPQVRTTNEEGLLWHSSERHWRPAWRTSWTGWGQCETEAGRSKAPGSPWPPPCSLLWWCAPRGSEPSHLSPLPSNQQSLSWLSERAQLLSTGMVMVG